MVDEVTLERLPASALEALAERFRGSLIGPEHPAYDEVRRVWNGMADRRPALIARCTGTADVLAALAFAREQGLVVAVRGGGHSLAGFSTCDGGVVIDCSPMKGVSVDPARRVVRVRAGVTLGELDHETQAFGLAVPAGVVSHTGVAGLTLGGGVGLLMRKFGLTIDNLLSADVVTADGRLVRASEHEHPDLFWGVRGGGGNFGIVTEFEFRAHPVGPELLAGFLLWPLERAHEVFAGWQEFCSSVADDLTSVAALFEVPHEPPFPPELYGQGAVAVAGCWAGDPAEGERVLRPLRSMGPPTADLFSMRPFVMLQRLSDDQFAWGRRYYMKIGHMGAVPEAAVDVMLDAFADRPVWEAEIDIHHIAGAVARVPEDATAYPGRAVPYAYDIPAMWDDPADDDRCIAWTRELVRALEPFSMAGGYVNVEADVGESVVRSVYGAKLERLAAIKRVWDPDNMFRVNQNIVPAG